MVIKTFVPAVIKKVKWISDETVIVTVELLSADNEPTNRLLNVQCRPGGKEYVEGAQCAVAVMLPLDVFNNITIDETTELYLPSDPELILTCEVMPPEDQTDNLIGNTDYHAVHVYVLNIPDYTLNGSLHDWIPLPEYPNPGSTVNIRITVMKAPVSDEEKPWLIVGTIKTVEQVTTKLCDLLIEVHSIGGQKINNCQHEIWIPFPKDPNFKTGAPIMFAAEII